MVLRMPDTRRKRAEELAEELVAAERELSGLQVCTPELNPSELPVVCPRWLQLKRCNHADAFRQAASLTLDKLEESYWHEFNDFQLQLRVHVDERDTTLSKVCLS